MEAVPQQLVRKLESAMKHGYVRSAGSSQFLDEGKELLSKFYADSSVLMDFLSYLRDDGSRELADLLPYCEDYSKVHKLALYVNPAANIMLRLHLFDPGNYDLPHSHRSHFGSLTLFGGYLHKIYRSTVQGEPRQVFSEQTRPGSIYAMDYNAIHSVESKSATISLVIMTLPLRSCFRAVRRGGQLLEMRKKPLSEPGPSYNGHPMNVQQALRTISEIQRINSNDQLTLGS